jgi:transposase InsO family protein
MPWRPKVPSPTWRSFLRNHLPDIAAIDMFVIATATFQLLYTLIVLSLDRRRIVHFEVTANPTQDWLSGQMTEAFPWHTAPRYLLRDRDKSYGLAFRHRVRAMGIIEVITAPRSPWQNPYVERLIGSIRRECLDHVIILSVELFSISSLRQNASLARQGLSKASSRNHLRKWGWVQYLHVPYQGSGPATQRDRPANAPDLMARNGVPAASDWSSS